MQDARQRLIEALPFLILGVSVAKVGEGTGTGKTLLGIIHQNADGSGCLGATLEAEPFFQDVLEVLGFKDFEDFLAKTEPPEES